MNIGKNYFMTTKKCNKIIISCLWTDWKNKSFCNVSLFANIFRDIPQILLNRRHLKCFKKSAHIFLNMKKFNIMMKRKQLIMIYWQISIEKYVPKHPISLIKIFFVTFLRYWMIKKTILKMISTEWTMKEDVKNWLYTLDEQIFTVKTSDRSQNIPKKFLYKTTFSVQLQWNP